MKNSIQFNSISSKFILMTVIQFILIHGWSRGQCPPNTNAVYLSGTINSGGPYTYNSDVIVASGTSLALQGVTFLFNL